MGRPLGLTASLCIALIFSPGGHVPLMITAWGQRNVSSLEFETKALSVFAFYFIGDAQRDVLHSQLESKHL